MYKLTRRYVGRDPGAVPDMQTREIRNLSRPGHCTREQQAWPGVGKARVSPAVLRREAASVSGAALSPSCRRRLWSESLPTGRRRTVRKLPSPGSTAAVQPLGSAEARGQPVRLGGSSLSKRARRLQPGRARPRVPCFARGHGPGAEPIEQGPALGTVARIARRQRERYGHF